jgi:hypothetical protein
VSYKTDRLVDLFPEVYAATDTESLLYKILDSVGLQLMNADEDVKRLLKSHWVDYASGTGLDGLGASFGVARRQVPNPKKKESADPSLPDFVPESDDAFRQRLKSVVRLFTGGGTPAAIKGAVRSALGLPFDLSQLNLPEQYEILRTDIKDLIELVEFSPTSERIIFDIVNEVSDASELMLVVDLASVQEDKPRIEWTFTSGAGRWLSLTLLTTGTGIKSTDELLVQEGDTLVLSATSTGNLSAVIGNQDVTALFTNLDGTVPAVLPTVPATRSEWKFRASSGLYDISSFDSGDTYDLPQFRVEMLWTRYQPLTFEVRIPYRLDTAVAALAARRGYTGDLFVFEGLPPERIQEVVDQTKAAGVQGSVQFSINLYDDQDLRESAYQMHGTHHLSEREDERDSLMVGSVNRMSENQDAQDSLVIVAVFDVSPFDSNHGFE